MSTFFIDLWFLVFEEIEESLDETSKFDNSEIFQFEEISEIFFSIFNFFLEGV